MERKFKVGDKVRFIGNVAAHINSSVLICHKDELIVNDILNSGDVFVSWSNNGHGPYRHYTWNMATNEIELIEFTKDNLEPGDMVTLRNGDKLILNKIRACFTDFEDGELDTGNCLSNMYDVTDDLLYIGDDRDSDIMKVERPTYHTVYERVEEKKEPKKMTVAEISKELGYDVEIVKG